MTLFYDEIYSSGLDRSARFPVDRYFRIAEQVERDDRDGLIELRRPRTATREEILLVHQCDYVDRFLAQDLEEGEIRRIGLRPWKPEIVERTMRLVGGAIEGLDLLFAGIPIAGNIPGVLIMLFGLRVQDIVFLMIWQFVQRLPSGVDRQNLS